MGWRGQEFRSRPFTSSDPIAMLGSATA